MSKYTVVILLLMALIHNNCCVEVHFEAADSGFFLKHSRLPPLTPEIANILTSPVPPTKSRSSYDSVLSLDRFTVVETTQPVSIRASYGPFSTKQTVPARYIVPDTMESQSDYLNNTTAALLELQQPNMHLDISAHLVRPTIPQDSPVLRVLFHAGADPGGHLQRQKVCVLLHVSLGSEIPLKGRCMPEGEDGVCVAEVIIPFNWWPALPPPNKEGPAGTPQKVPQRLAQISYSVFEPPLRNPEQCEPKVQIQPLTTFAQVPLVPAKMPFRELRADDALTFLLPQHPLYPMSKIHVPVFLHQSHNDQRVAAFTLRARVKSGIRIMGATATSDHWNISIEKENPKHTTARVTAFRKDHDQTTPINGDNNKSEAALSTSASSYVNNNNTGIVEVFSWLLEVAEDSNEIVDGGKIVWSVTYVYDSQKDKDTSEVIATDEGKKRLIAKLEINKDDIQAVLPMAKVWELMNTAVLTGRQVAQAMKVFIVSQAGKVADVTLQSSCHAEDESVIKVSSSCSSVYVDGSEIRGSSNASVIVKYGTYAGLAKFIVWMPEFPLEVYISDFRLSQIKGWKVLDDNHYLHNKQSRRRKKRSYLWGQHGANYYNNVGAEKMVCRARYQQSPVEVYAKFLAVDQNSGRISFFISRRTGLRVTDLVQPLLRVADPKIASLKGRILQGKSMGRTDVQVLSPITGRVIGAKEIRVGSDKVNLSRLIVRVVSGLQLTITPDNTIENGYLAETSVTHKLTAQYQEGLLDIDLEFTDGSRTPLRDISVEDYFLLVESLDTEVVAFAPMLASHHPRVIAVGEGNGNLLRVTLLLSEDCRVRRNTLSSKQNKSNVPPLASALASIEVDFNNVDIVSKQESIQNDGIVGRDRKGFRSSGDLADIIVGIPLRDSSQHYEPTVQARQHRGSIQANHKSRYGKKGAQGNMTSMEVGMYVLLTAFCFAIIVFVISCVVYASKFRPVVIETGLDPMEAATKGGSNVTFRNMRLKESTTNAHDWVWLGRSTIDRHSVMTESGGNSAEVGGVRDSRIRITSNPIMNYDSSTLVNKNITSFDQPSMRGNALTAIPNLNKTETEHYAMNESRANPTDYKPPVPPHRNICPRTIIVNQNSSTSLNEHTTNKADKMLNQHNKGNNKFGNDYNNDSDIHEPAINIHKTNAANERTDQRTTFNQSERNIQQLKPQTQQQPKHMHRVSPEHNILLPATAVAATAAAAVDNHHLINSVIKSPPCRISHDEMHNAEKLIEFSNHQQKNVFQFDSLTPKRVLKNTPKGQNRNNNNNKNHTNINKSSAHGGEGGVGCIVDSSSDNVVIGGGGGVGRYQPTTTSATAPTSKASRVKRATVVGNPMFSATVDETTQPGESLGLDDLDMDYEQIMHYFDNLKESNA